jgi:hypothetical protein
MRKSLEAQVEKHRDAYNQALGGLQLLDHLEGTAGRESVSEGQLEKMLDARIQSVEPLEVGSGD